MTIQTIVFDSAWLTRNGLVAYQLDGSEEDGGADANDLDPARHRPGCFRERLLRRSDPFVEALHVNRLAHSCNTRLRTASGASRPGTSGCRDRRRPRTESGQPPAPPLAARWRSIIGQPLARQALKPPG